MIFAIYGRRLINAEKQAKPSHHHQQALLIVGCTAPTRVGERNTYQTRILFVNLRERKLRVAIEVCKCPKRSEAVSASSPSACSHIFLRYALQLRHLATSVPTCLYIYMHRYKLTYIHMYIHIYIYVCVCVGISILIVFSFVLPSSSPYPISLLPTSLSVPLRQVCGGPCHPSRSSVHFSHDLYTSISSPSYFIYKFYHSIAITNLCQCSFICSCISYFMPPSPLFSLLFFFSFFLFFFFLLLLLLLLLSLACSNSRSLSLSVYIHLLI